MYRRHERERPYTQLVRHFEEGTSHSVLLLHTCLDTFAKNNISARYLVPNGVWQGALTTDLVWIKDEDNQKWKRSMKPLSFNFCVTQKRRITYHMSEYLQVINQAMINVQPLWPVPWGQLCSVEAKGTVLCPRQALILAA